MSLTGALWAMAIGGALGAGYAVMRGVLAYRWSKRALLLVCKIYEGKLDRKEHFSMKEYDETTALCIGQIRPLAGRNDIWTFRQAFPELAEIEDALK